MIKIFEYLIFYLDDGSPLKITDLIDKIVDWDPRIRSLARSDSVNSVLRKWSNKYTAKLSIQSMRRLIDEFMLTHLQVKSNGSETENKFWERADYFIETLAMIFKQDLEEIENIITTYVNDKSVKPSEFWIYLNSSYREAYTYKRSWALTLSNNNQILKLYELRKIPIHIWVSENCSEFDMNEYQKLNKENKNSNQFNARLRLLAQTVNTGFRGQKSAYKQKQSPQKRMWSKSNDSPAKKLFAWLIPAFQEIAGKIDWPDTHCGFYQSKEGCKNEKCKRIHKCPICDADHKLNDCPEKTKK